MKYVFLKDISQIIFPFIIDHQSILLKNKKIQISKWYNLNIDQPFWKTIAFVLWSIFMSVSNLSGK